MSARVVIAAGYVVVAVVDPSTAFYPMKCAMYLSLVLGVREMRARLLP